MTATQLRIPVLRTLCVAQRENSGAFCRPMTTLSRCTQQKPAAEILPTQAPHTHGRTCVLSTGVDTGFSLYTDEANELLLFLIDL